MSAIDDFHKLKSNNKQYKIWLACILLVIIMFLIFFKFVEPAPPKPLRLAAGDVEGYYYQVAQKYKEALEKFGIQLEIIETQGSLENRELLTNGKVDLAFIQGGVAESIDEDVATLASVFYEPVFVFSRPEIEIKELRDLKGMKINIGEVNSGSRVLAEKLLFMNGITEKNTSYSFLDNDAMESALMDQEIDAAIIVISVKSNLVHHFISNKGIRPFNFIRAEAYTYQMRSLSHLIIPQGAISLEKNLPKGDYHLLSSIANVCVRENFHPQQAELILKVMQGIHDKKDLITPQDYFPNAEFGDYPMLPAAKHYLEEGPSFLTRYLPYSTAIFIKRTWIILVPALTLLIPFFKFAPMLYRMQLFRKIYLWYEALVMIEWGLEKDLSVEKIQEGLEDLQNIDQEISGMKIPIMYRKEVYNLRVHIELVRSKLEKLQKEVEA